MRRLRGEQPHLITDAPVGPDVEYDYRRKRYAIMMAGRAICVVLAVLVYKWSPVLAFLLVVGGGVLPWSAVIMANDRLTPKQRKRHGIAAPLERTLPPGHDPRVIDADFGDEHRGDR